MSHYEIIMPLGQSCQQYRHIAEDGDVICYMMAPDVAERVVRALEMLDKTEPAIDLFRRGMGGDE